MIQMRYFDFVPYSYLLKVKKNLKKTFILNEIEGIEFEFVKLNSVVN